jgi:hypothetical protein
MSSDAAASPPAIGMVDGLNDTTRVKLATYNIVSGRAGRLEQALRSLDIGNVDIAVLTEAKFTHWPPLRVDQIPCCHILDTSPTEQKIISAVKLLRNGKAPGPSGMRAEQLKKWLEDRENSEEWRDLVDVAQECFRTGVVPQQLKFSTLVLIPKADGSLRGIGLLEVIWKLISMIIKVRLAGIPLDDALHGFRPGRGTGMATLCAKLLTERSLRQGTTLY